MNQNELIIRDENDKDIKCKVLFTYHSDKYLKDYIVYENVNNHEIYASIYNANDNSTFTPIESIEEYNMLNNILDKMSIL